MVNSTTDDPKKVSLTHVKHLLGYISPFPDLAVGESVGSRKWIRLYRDGVSLIGIGTSGAVV